MADNKPSFSADDAGKVGGSILAGLLRLTITKRLGAAFLLFLALTAGNLILVEELYDGVSGASAIVNNSGKLRYLSQEIAYYATRSVKERHRSELILDNLAAAYEERLSAIEESAAELGFLMQSHDLPGRLGALRNLWRSYNDAVQSLHQARSEAEAEAALARIYDISPAMLRHADGIVSMLTAASQNAHRVIDLLVYSLFVLDLGFLILIFHFVRRRISAPIVELSRLARRFSAGDYSGRLAYRAEDEIGDLVQAFNHTAEVVAKLIRGLNERVRETTALHQVARLLQDETRPVEEILMEILALLPHAWQYPEVAVARIRHEGKEYVTINFRETPWRQTTRFDHGGQPVSIEVFYLEERPQRDEGPFLNSERALLNSVAEMLRGYLDRHQMRQARARLTAILEATPDFVGTFAPDGHALYVNRAGRRLLGLGEGEGVSRLALGSCHPTWARELIEQTGLPAAARDGVWPGETALLAPGGREVPVSQVIIAHKTVAGEVAYYSTIMRDISQRKAMEARLAESLAALRASEERLAGVMESLDDVVWSVSATDFRSLYFSPGIEKVYGRPAADFFADPGLWLAMVHPEDRERVRHSADELMTSGTKELEYRIVRPDGEVRWLHDRGRLVRSPEGVPLRLDGIATDITARRLAEESLRIWQRAIESSVNAIMITDASRPDHPISYVNPAFERITGYSADEVIGKNPALLQNGDRDQPQIEAIRLAAKECREGHAVLRNYRKDGSLFWNELFIAPVRDEHGGVSHYVGVLNDITERKTYEAQLEHQANHDALTGLPNRSLLQDRLAQGIAHAQRHKRALAVLFLDLDHFKYINDSFGHATGDLLLRGVAGRLASCVRQGDTVARHGGDEFVLVLGDLAREEDVSDIARKVMECTARPFSIHGHELFVNCSIGISLHPRDGEDAQTLLKNADTAMYRAKEQGRNNFQYFAAEMNERAVERLLLENSLRHALERREFLLHYQPKVDLHSGEVVGVEALVRWQHPEKGLIPPAKFIPVAEESGLIVPLGEWVLDAACAQAKAWQEQGLPPVRVAVNLSARQFQRADVVATVSSALKKSGLDPKYLELEITESLIMHNVEAAIDILHRLKKLGVMFSVDDFGTGYSSLAYLKRFPIDALKIDRSFVNGVISELDDAAIAKTVISMAHDMKLRVIAEGVETEEQLAFLRANRCDELQGYYFSKPVTADELAGLLREGKRLQVEEADSKEGRVLLLLDDEENILTSLARLLRQDGYRILKATSAQQAFELLATHPVGVILSDQRMPEMSGVEFLQRAKQLYPHTIRMVLSGYTDLKSVTDAINEGAVYKFLTKPWEDDLLRANIREAFERFEMARENERLAAEIMAANEALSEAKRELEMRVEEKTREALRNMNVLQVSQEMLEHLPIGVVGVDEEGLIAVANQAASRLLEGSMGPLVGSLAGERLPAGVAACLADALRGGSTAARYCHLYGVGGVAVWCHPMGEASHSRGAVVVMLPGKEPAP